MPVVLYGCENWSLTLKEERRLRVFKNRVLRIFGPKKDEVTREWIKVHNEELNDLNSSPNIVRVIKSKRMRGARHVHVWGRREACTGFWWGKPEGKRPLRRPWRRWEVNIEMDLPVMGSGAMNWIDLALGRDRCWALVTAVMNLRVPRNAGNFLTS